MLEIVGVDGYWVGVPLTEGWGKVDIGYFKEENYQ
jgi:hypothetical protein